MAFNLYRAFAKVIAPKFAARVGRALIRAEESARRTARMFGTPLYVWENGRVVAKRP